MTALTYARCPVISDIIEVWLIYAGDGQTWRDMVNHRQGCQTCRDNEIVFKAWRDDKKKQKAEETTK